MQIRRPGLWIFFGLLAVYGFLVMGGGMQMFADMRQELDSHSLLYTVADSVATGELILPLCVGCLLADRLIRDRRIKVEELINTIDIPLSTRLWGKYFGTLTATITPIFLISCFFQGSILVISHNLLVIPFFLFSFLVIALPGLLFVAAFSLGCPTVMPVALYQFLFAGYWLWGNLFLKQQVLPTLSRTVLTPSGAIIANGFFGTNTELLGITPSYAAVASIVVLLTVTAVVMIALTQFLQWRQMHD